MPTTTPRIIASRYRLELYLGEGVSGTVYRATDLLLDRQVAVKRMKVVEERDRSQGIEAFQTEARTLAQIEHPHIVDIHDVGLDEDGKPYFVMELVEHNLRSVLSQRGGPLGLEELLGLFLPLCGALACAHDLRIVHCDLKPENIAVREMSGQRLRGKLLDFSISRRGEGPLPAGVVFGTPGYMAPEQIRGERCTPRSDVWALGALLFEGASGRLPFTGQDVLELSRRIIAEDAPPLEKVAPHLPRPITLAIDRALARHPARRYADMREFAHALVSSAVQVNLNIPADPDPIGLPDAPRWRAESGATTDSLLPLAAPLDVVPDDESPLRPLDPAPRSGAPSAEAAASRRRPARGRSASRLLVLVALAALSSALYFAAWAGRAQEPSTPSALPGPGPSERASGPATHDALAPSGAPSALSSAQLESHRTSERAGPTARAGEDKPRASSAASTAHNRRKRPARRVERQSAATPEALELQNNWEW